MLLMRERKTRLAGVYEQKEKPSNAKIARKKPNKEKSLEKSAQAGRESGMVVAGVHSTPSQPTNQPISRHPLTYSLPTQEEAPASPHPPQQRQCCDQLPHGSTCPQNQRERHLQPWP
jgi:hypothetical protein